MRNDCGKSRLSLVLCVVSIIYVYMVQCNTTCVLLLLQEKLTQEQIEGMSLPH